MTTEQKSLLVSIAFHRFCIRCENMWLSCGHINFKLFPNSIVQLLRGKKIILCKYTLRIFLIASLSKISTATQSNNKEFKCSAHRC